MELIDKEKAILKMKINVAEAAALKATDPVYIGFLQAFETLFVSELNEQPLIDAVEVVRCCDCKYSVVPYKDSDDNVPYLYCHNPNLDEDALSPKVDFTDFCSYGRRESEGT